MYRFNLPTSIENTPPYWYNCWVLLILTSNSISQTLQFYVMYSRNTLYQRQNAYVECRDLKLQLWSSFETRTTFRRHHYQEFIYIFILQNVVCFSNDFRVETRELTYYIYAKSPRSVVLELWELFMMTVIIFFLLAAYAATFLPITTASRP